MTFGIPTTRRQAANREAVVEKYPNTPVLTVRDVPVEQGKYFKMNLNPAAIAALGIEGEDDMGTVSFAFQGREIFIGATPEGETNFLKVHKNGNIANKPYYQYIRRMLEIPGGEIELELVESDGLYKLEVIEQEELATAIEEVSVEDVLTDTEKDELAYANAQEIEAQESFEQTEGATIQWS